MGIELIINIVHATLQTGTPLILVALDEILSGKSGVLNLYQQSMLLMSSAVDFLIELTTKNIFVAMLLNLATIVVLAKLASRQIKTQRNTVARQLLLTTGVIIKKIEFSEKYMQTIKHNITRSRLKFGDTYSWGNVKKLLLIAPQTELNPVKLL